MKTIAQILKDVRPDVDFVVSTNYIADGLLDSLDIIKLVAELDENFGVSIEGNEIASRNFVDTAAIEKLVQKSKPRSLPA